MLTHSYSYVLLFLAAGVVFVLGPFVTSWFLRPNKPTKEKLSAYECGESTTGTSFVQYNVRYYLFALCLRFLMWKRAFYCLGQWCFKEFGVFGFIEGGDIYCHPAFWLALCLEKEGAGLALIHKLPLLPKKIPGGVIILTSADFCPELGQRVQPLADEGWPGLLRH